MNCSSAHWAVIGSQVLKSVGESLPVCASGSGWCFFMWTGGAGCRLDTFAELMSVPPLAVWSRAERLVKLVNAWGGKLIGCRRWRSLPGLSFHPSFLLSLPFSFLHLISTSEPFSFSSLNPPLLLCILPFHISYSLLFLSFLFVLFLPPQLSLLSFFLPPIFILFFFYTNLLSCLLPSLSLLPSLLPA